MTMTPEQQQKLQEWLRTKRARNQCPHCGTNQWAAGDVIAAPVFAEGGFNIGGPTIPMAQLLCASCGSVWLISAVMAGLVS